MDSWKEVRTACDTNLSVAASISAIAFDPYQELLWTGNEKGRVASHYSSGLHRYTSFRAHLNPVRQILVSDRGVITLSSDSVKMNNRRGLVRWTLSNEDTSDLHCMSYTTMPNSEILAAGKQHNMLVINVARGIVVKKVESESDIVVMRKSRLVCCGANSGEVTLRDPRTFKVEHRVQAHTGTISDIDTVGNLLLTCGSSARNGNLIIDPLVKVYDIRTMRPLVPMSFPTGPCFLKMHPKLSTTVFIVSRSGQFHVCDIGNPSNIHFYQANTSSYISAIDLSTSGEMLAFGDSASCVHLWGDRKEAKINAYSNPIELPAIPTPTPNITISEKSSLSLIGMPYYKEPLLSVWPSNMKFEVGNPPPKIDPDILRNMKMIDFVGYSPNPGNKKRNQVERYSRKKHKAGTPKFRSEKERELQSGKSLREPSSLFDDETELDATSTKMPKYYKRVEIQYSRFGVDDFDFEFYNKTHYAGLETHITNSYCNSLLQVLFFTPVLRLITRSHIGTACAKENCLCCELGFLFRMLENAKGRNCQASNFLRAFSTIPQASALGLFEPDEPDENTPYSMLIQNFNRFILEQLHQECNSNNNPRLLKSLPLEQTPLSMIQQLFGMQVASISKCQCEIQSERLTTPFVVDLQFFSKNHKGKERESKTKTFVDILRTSIQREIQQKAWCDNCQQYVPTTAKKIPKSLPPVLSINCGAGTSVPIEIWRTHDGQSAWLPKRISMDLDDNDLLTVKELPSDAIVDVNTSGSSKNANYELMAVISQVRVEKEIPHLVAFVKVPKSELESTSKSPWYLFNDFLVKNVTEQEVFNFQGVWKTPVVLYYSRVDISDLMDTSDLPSEIDKSILFEDISISKHHLTNKKLSVLLTPEELPQPGTLVAIDAEFVALNQEETEFRSDGTKSVIRPSRLSLARVSVLRGEGAKENIPFIDDYIAASEPVVDYLTEFSGIEVGDLDPASSKHTLVPLKIAYKKLRLLLDLGCVFVGHGLKKDFRIINILVPSEQVIDTVDIFHIKNRQRKISLRFLAWYLLNQNIQTDTHDSIEDARTALSIYKKYLQFKSEGRFEKVLEDIYNEGRKYNWKPTPGVFPTSCVESHLNSYSTLPETSETTNTTEILPPSTSEIIENQNF
ncbi:ubiquitin carboxyl-terminal hydrolase-domain-containing protein [Glomus cerebriforme]|uniref:PAN2-PAN3 deadenylation complex catalytic subunit PAN2 n=1 Tax=Glomus cerebriforme TaxID=658196 RepID=A0A397T4X3_9GLOM|nr:ubiquitin carboxyl-terminal hydrolase-domain-containing protein [Glomus cerebriforme]